MSRLVFNPEFGLQAPEASAIRADIEARFKAAFFEDGAPELNTDPTSPAGQLVDALVAEIEAEYADFLYLSNMFNPNVADGRWQDALGNIYFLTRKLAEPTIVVCELKGIAGTKVPYGLLAESSEGQRFIHTQLSASIGADGSLLSPFRCAAPGPVEVAANTVNRIVTTVPGLDSISNPDAGVMGRNVETRADFEARRAASVAKNAHGSVAAIYGSLHDLSGVAGVIDVKVLENIGPDPIVEYGVEVPGHGITVCIFGGTDDDIAKIIYMKKDGGCDTGGNTTVRYTDSNMGGAVYEYKILRPASVNFWVRVTLGESEDLTPDLEAKIKQAIVDDFSGQSKVPANPRVGLASKVYASRFYASLTEGIVENLLSITIALGETVEAGDYGDSVTIRGDQEPAMSAANVTVVVG
jgi:uncharacterized phage protein gp47/JayE